MIKKTLECVAFGVNKKQLPVLFCFTWVLSCFGSGRAGFYASPFFFFKQSVICVALRPQDEWTCGSWSALPVHLRAFQLIFLADKICVTYSKGLDERHWISNTWPV